MSFINYYQFTNEILYLGLFVFVITVNKYVLSVLRFTEPTVFQGWQTLVCVVLLSVLFKLEKIKNELQILDKKTVYLLLPSLCCFTLSIVAGSISLASLPIPVFLAITNLVPAIHLLLEDRRTKEKESSPKLCGSLAVCGTVVTLLVLKIPQWRTETLMWLCGHILMVLIPPLYHTWMHLPAISATTIICYNNFFSVAILVPVSLYLDVLHLPNVLNLWEDAEFYLGCLLSGVSGTFMQLWSTKVQTKERLLCAQGIGKLLCSGLASLVFYGNVEPIEWLLIILNLSISTYVFGLSEGDVTFHQLVGLPIKQGINEEVIV